MTKTTFEIEELPQAVEQLYRLRLLEGWTGCLKLESNGKKLVISQFPSSNTWTQGYERVHMIEDWFTWGEIECFYERSDGRIEIESYDTNAAKGEHYERVEIVTKEEAFNRLREANFFEGAECQAYAALNDILVEIEKKELEA
jgi:hypothetical protein